MSRAIPLFLLIVVSTAGAMLVLQNDNVQRNADVARRRMRQLWQAVEKYRLIHEEAMPADPADLFPQYVSDPLAFYHPGDSDPPPTTIDNSVPNAPNSARISFEWDLTRFTAAGEVLLRDNTAENNGGQFVILVARDGLIETDPPLAIPFPRPSLMAQQHMRRIYRALAIYANQYEEHVPLDLRTLLDLGLLESPRTFWNPGDSQPLPDEITNSEPDALNSTLISFDYNALNGFVFQAGPDAIVLRDNTANNNAGEFVNLIRANGVIETDPFLAAPTPTALEYVRRNLACLASVISIYASDNDEFFPVSLSQLWPGFVESPRAFWNPGDSNPVPTDITNSDPNLPNSARISYWYAFEGRPTLISEVDPNEIVLRDNTVANNRGLGLMVTSLGGQVDFVPDCRGDVDSDNDVDLDDLTIILQNFGLWYEADPWEGDINADTFVDLADLELNLVNFGRVCP